MLSEQECERARQARDRRFDGRFFIGVVTTGVYCRPVCPVRIPMAKNVRFFASAAAAGSAGFRPCLRCRPEAAPGSPAWRGKEVTVARALRLIDQGALDGSGNTVEVLAARLGVGARHLARLFGEHVGASPVAVAQTRRLHFAKKLIDETDLPLTQVALSAGFGSVRRFNAVLHKTYGRTPGELRRKRRRGARPPQQRVSLRLAYRPPEDLTQLFRFFAAHSIDGIESVTEQCYRRSARVDGVTLTVEVRPVADGVIELSVSPQAASCLMTVVARARALFDLDANPSAIRQHLTADPRAAAWLGNHDLPRLPGGWDPYELLVRTIIGQGVSVASARTFGARLVHAYGDPYQDDGLSHLFPQPAVLRAAELTSIGLTGARSTAIAAVSEAVLDGRIDFAAVDCLDALSAIAGIGPWTRDYVALRGLGHPDAFPAEDLILRRVLGVKTAAQARRLAEPWRPWRGYAAMLLWQQST